MHNYSDPEKKQVKTCVEVFRTLGQSHKSPTIHRKYASFDLNTHLSVRNIPKKKTQKGTVFQLVQHGQFLCPSIHKH